MSVRGGALFTKWMNSKGYEVQTEGVYKQLQQDLELTQELLTQLTNRFNESAWMGYLKLFQGAVKCLQRFEDAGYTFECLTSQSEDIYAGYLRKYNLEMLLVRLLQNALVLLQVVTKTSI